MSISHQRRQGDGTVDGQILEAVKKGSKSELYKEADEFFGYTKPVISAGSSTVVGNIPLLDAYGRYDFSFHFQNDNADNPQVEVILKDTKGNAVHKQVIAMEAISVASRTFSIIGRFGSYEISVSGGDLSVCQGYYNFYGYREAFEPFFFEFLYKNMGVVPSARFFVTNSVENGREVNVDYSDYDDSSGWQTYGLEVHEGEILVLRNGSPDSEMRFDWRDTIEGDKSQIVRYDESISVFLPTVDRYYATKLQFISQL